MRQKYFYCGYLHFNITCVFNTALKVLTGTFVVVPAMLNYFNRQLQAFCVCIHGITAEHEFIQYTGVLT